MFRFRFIVIVFTFFIAFFVCDVYSLSATDFNHAKSGVVVNGNSISGNPVANEDIYKFDDVKPMPQPDIKTLVLKVFIVLVLIIICIVVLSIMIWVFSNQKKNLFTRKERYIELVDRVVLDNKRSVYLIKVIDEVFILGGGCDGLNLLGKITDKDKVDAVSGREFMPLLDLFSRKIDTVKGSKDV